MRFWPDYKERRRGRRRNRINLLRSHNCQLLVLSTFSLQPFLPTRSGLRSCRLSSRHLVTSIRRTPRFAGYWEYPRRPYSQSIYETLAVPKHKMLHTSRNEMSTRVTAGCLFRFLPQPTVTIDPYILPVLKFFYASEKSSASTL